jgi:hypothetical protein
MHSRLVAALVLIGFANAALANNRFYSYYVGIGDPDKAVRTYVLGTRAVLVLTEG